MSEASYRSSNCDPSRHRFYIVLLRPDCPEQQDHHYSAEVPLQYLVALWYPLFGNAPFLGVLEEPVSLVARSGLCREPRGLKYLQETVESCTAPIVSQSTRLPASKGLKSALGRRADLSHGHMVHCRSEIVNRYMYLL